MEFHFRARRQERKTILVSYIFRHRGTTGFTSPVCYKLGLGGSVASAPRPAIHTQGNGGLSMRCILRILAGSAT